MHRLKCVPIENIGPGISEDLDIGLSLGRPVNNYCQASTLTGQVIQKSCYNGSCRWLKYWRGLKRKLQASSIRLKL